VSCAEIGEQTAFDEARVKDLTGGDMLAVRRMNEDFWNLIPTHKLLIAGNHKPIVRGDDKGIWRRIRLIPWLFTAHRPDPDLPRKLLQELPGILRWAVNGAEEWCRLGLSEPSAVHSATQEYRAESNIIGEFLTTCTLHHDARCTAAELRRHYEKWCKDEGHSPLGGRMLGQRLKREGLEPKPIRVGAKTVRGWVGITVPAQRQPWEPGED
jgi:putative DNA primase/helicase